MKKLNKAKDGVSTPTKRSIPEPKKKGAMDALKALKWQVSTLGGATEGYNPAPSKEAKKSMPESKMKAGGMIKRADGSMSKRGLWDNIRANKGSGKKPTSAMLKQEKKIKAKKAQNGDEVKTVERGELENVTVTDKAPARSKPKMPSTTPSKSMDLSDKIKSVASSDNKKTGRFQAFKNDMKSSLRGLPKALRPIGATVAAGVNAIGGQMGFKKRTEAQKRAGELNRDEKKMGGKVMMKTKK